MSKHEQITEQIVDALKRVDPTDWRRPWASFNHRNGHTAREYRGVNTWLLAINAMLGGFESTDWWTFNQARNDGGCVRKGEKGTHVTFFKVFEQEDEDTGEVAKRPVLRTYCVFNRDQIDGLPDVERAEPLERFAAADETIASTGAQIESDGQRAYYAVTTDRIVLPPIDAFSSTEGYYATVFHELGHWTGATSRLNRDLSGRFGDEAYAMEELVAELASAFVCGHLGIVADGAEFDTFAQYVASWIKVLESDRYAVFTAARAAQEAADYIVGEEQVDDDV